MRRPTRREGLLCVAAACLGAAFVLWVSGSGPRDREGGGTSEGAIDAPVSFTISGDIGEPIVPGAHESLDLSLENPNDVDLTVDRITVTITEVDAPQADAARPCGVADFDVRQIAADIEVTLGANRTDRLSSMGVAATAWPTVGMLNRPVNQDGCRGAILTLGYGARGLAVQP